MSMTRVLLGLPRIAARKRSYSLIESIASIGGRGRLRQCAQPVATKSAATGAKVQNRMDTAGESCIFRGQQLAEQLYPDRRATSVPQTVDRNAFCARELTPWCAGYRESGSRESRAGSADDGRKSR